MPVLIPILFVTGIVLLVIDIWLLLRFCTAGSWGNPDVWSNKNAEKVHYIIAPLPLVFIIITMILCLIIC